LYAEGNGPIHRVSDEGNKPVAITQLDQARKENSHRWPFFLPDGHHFLYTVLTDTKKDDGIYLASVDSPKSAKLLLSVRSNASYAQPGYLLYCHEESLLAQAFDLKKLQLQGKPFVVADNVAYHYAKDYGYFSVSNSGALSAIVSKPVLSRLLWFDRNGRQIGEVGTAAEYASPRLSHDGRRLAVAIKDPQTKTYDIWIQELGHDTSTRFTFHLADEWEPLWSPDDSKIVFDRYESNVAHLYQKASNGIGTEQALFSMEGASLSDWSSDGRFLLFHSPVRTGAQLDLWLYSFQERTTRPIVQTDFMEGHGRLSRDGQWIAYNSVESGKFEVYVQSFEGSAGRWRISKAGGSTPRWSRDGKELYYIDGDDNLISVPVKMDSSFEFSSGVPLFRTSIRADTDETEYDISSDGQRFLINTVEANQGEHQIAIILNWTAGLK